MLIIMFHAVDDIYILLQPIRSGISGLFPIRDYNTGNLNKAAISTLTKVTTFLNM